MPFITQNIQTASDSYIQESYTSILKPTESIVIESTPMPTYQEYQQIQNSPSVTDIPVTYSPGTPTMKLLQDPTQIFLASELAYEQETGLEPTIKIDYETGKLVLVDKLLLGESQWYFKKPYSFNMMSSYGVQTKNYPVGTKISGRVTENGVEIFTGVTGMYTVIPMEYLSQTMPQTTQQASIIPAKVTEKVKEVVAALPTDTKWILIGAAAIAGILIIRKLFK